MNNWIYLLIFVLCNLLIIILIIKLIISIIKDRHYWRTEYHSTTYFERDGKRYVRITAKPANSNWGESFEFEVDEHDQPVYPQNFTDAREESSPIYSGKEQGDLTGKD